MKTQKTPNIDQLFITAEKLAKDFSIFPKKDNLSIDHHIQGLLSEVDIDKKLEELKRLDVDEYIEQVVLPTEAQSRMSTRNIIDQLGYRIINEKSDGPFYTAEAEVDFYGEFRRIGFICQDRSSNNGAWMPEHHIAASKAIIKYAALSIPVVGLVDTPGADAGELANLNNQAHSISRLLAEFSNADVPSVGIIVGVGYSGGAIPLVTTNLILSVRDGIYNTIQPKGLASIARKYNLSWQECAKYVGVSPYELTKQGCIDGIIDYVPGELPDKLANFHNAIVSSIQSIEKGAQKFVRENPYILEHYHSSIQRYLNPTPERLALEGDDGLALAANPTEHLNVFGVAYKYLRYLSLRKRIHSTNADYYGRLAKVEIPEGELQKRLQEEKKRAFNGWIQNPDKLIYDDTLKGAWKDYLSKQSDLNEDRSTIRKLFFGEPKRNFKDARSELFFQTGLFLYNRWKGNAQSNFLALMDYIKNYQNNLFLIRKKDFVDVYAFAAAINQAEDPFLTTLKNQILQHGKTHLDKINSEDTTPEQASKQLALALNSILNSGKSLFHEAEISEELLSDETKELVSNANASKSTICNRKVLEEVCNTHLKTRVPNTELPATNEITILDIILHEDFRNSFFIECQNILIFDAVYEHIVNNLFSIAEEAKDTKVISKPTVKNLLDSALEHAVNTADSFELRQSHISTKEFADILNEQFSGWIKYFVQHNDRGSFLATVEEWHSVINPQMSDSLFVIITFFFEKVLLEYYQSERKGKDYKGVINPVRIGRRKDFWNRLNVAYHDLLINNILNNVKKQKLNSSNAIIEKFLTNFEETRSNLLTSDPVKFPGFRISVEEALDMGKVPCGVITGFASFKSDQQNRKVGVLVSNVDFQAGAFDMASAEKFCDLLVSCAKENIPVVCFVSSGGMQTKEGAGALFSMAIVNDRITRFIRDNDLPVLIFGYGDCTGGAQASFVTHPLAETYYFSGTNMPFAGQVVVPAYLPTTCTLSNYLSLRNGAMQGLVKNPFVADLDEQLRAVDPSIPVPVNTVEEIFEKVMAGSYQQNAVEAEEVEQDKIALMRPVKKTLIHARGCTAVKLIRKAQENNIDVVLIQSDPDMQSVPAEMMRENDTLICIGGNTSDESYLNPHSVLRVAEHEKVDSLHPGIGFLSENAQFASLCHNHQINFIGPSVYSMEMMGNKSNAINTALALEVPVVPGSHGILTSSEKAASVAEKIGYPVLLKAVHGGGGKGIQVVESPNNIHEFFHSISTEAKSAFGNGDIYMEKYVTSLRHIEVQLIRDKFGNTKVLGLRDCSVQRNNQKVIEESGSTMLPENLKQDAFNYAAALADKVEYFGAGTVEFIYNLDANALYFMEMNTRLQVEHPVTEATSGVDIVSAQFEIASGGSIEKIEAKDQGFAIEVRVTAEKLEVGSDGEMDILPFPGMIKKCVMPEKDYIEIISMAATGKAVSPFYDSLIAQIICTGKDREDCVEKLIKYLEECTIHGICTNIPLLINILNDKTFREGIYDTTYLPKLLARIDHEKIINETEKYAGLDKVGVDTNAVKIEGSDELKVLAQSTGIFYTSSSPAEPNFVKEGDVITLDKTICLMEAMKIFTPLKLSSFNKSTGKLYPAEKYRVERVNNESGTQVASGDLLFVVKPV
jgi:acetyl/propionyl-CoA carboxylase alpha subunit/acetyl-CoA carboxylase alpha subunit